MLRISRSYNEDENRDPVQDTIWMAGLKATRPRMAIAKALFNEKNPISITTLQKRLPNISSTSIYRTLEALVEHGSVDRINTGDLHPSYEMALGRKHHHHVICTRCGDIEDVEVVKDCPAQKVQHAALAKSKKFNSIFEHSLEFFGLCKKCA